MLRADIEDIKAELAERFDLVSFDPRGVASSTAIDCAVDFDDDVTLLAAGDEGKRRGHAASLPICSPARSASAAMVSEGFTPRLAVTAAPSMTCGPTMVGSAHDHRRCTGSP